MGGRNASASFYTSLPEARFHAASVRAALRDGPETRVANCRVPIRGSAPDDESAETARRRGRCPEFLLCCLYWGGMVPFLFCLDPSWPNTLGRSVSVLNADGDCLMEDMKGLLYILFLEP